MHRRLLREGGVGRQWRCDRYPRPQTCFRNGVDRQVFCMFRSEAQMFLRMKRVEGL